MIHTVKSGETLSKIATIHGITLANLLNANPSFKANPNVVKVGQKLTIPQLHVAPAPAAPSAGGQAASAFATMLAQVAQEQHDEFHLMDEGDPALCKQIKKYWTELGLGFTSCVKVPWSAVFVSWCVKQAGASSAEFKFADAHSVFVHRAIQNQLNGTGVFRGRRITEHAPQVGDIIQNNRIGSTFNYDFARKNPNYPSHTAIVVKVDSDAAGPFALTIGGNEGDSIRRKVVRLTRDGLIKQRTNNPFICVIQNLKQ
ncbi:MAG TPA: DUF2272 domain-containing protein [Longimicrobium sp.]|nr:DUF2272 domain-containing protein [Longimicrobium sp.]